MAKNRASENALHISLPVPEGTKSGEPVLVNGIGPGVALTDRGAGGNLADEATVWRDGSWYLPVDGAVTEKFTKVYIIAASRTLTTTATGNTLFGYALEKKAAAVAPIEVVIAQV
jgi:predicted RecA/RadA family phage recombinase